jgi:septal ring factor EnvC (AmiA/AmiB activator)
MKITLVDGLPYHPTLKHPSTGKRLRALATVNGSPLWPVLGSDGDDDDGDSGGDSDSDKEGATDGKDEEKSKPEVDPALAKLQADFDRIKKQLSESDKKKSAAEKRLSEIESKDLSELEKAKKEVAEREKRESDLQTSFRQLAIDNAFLKTSQRLKINWHNPDVAQAAAKLGSLDIGSDGVVEGIEEAVKKLAKDNPFLVDKSSTDEEDAKDSKKDTKKGASGSGVGSGQNGGKGKKEDLDKQALLDRFPALRK